MASISSSLEGLGQFPPTSPIFSILLILSKLKDLPGKERELSLFIDETFNQIEIIYSYINIIQLAKKNAMEIWLSSNEELLKAVIFLDIDDAITEITKLKSLLEEYSNLDNDKSGEKMFFGDAIKQTITEHLNEIYKSILLTFNKLNLIINRFVYLQGNRNIKNFLDKLFESDEYKFNNTHNSLTRFIEITNQINALYEKEKLAKREKLETLKRQEELTNREETTKQAYANMTHLFETHTQKSERAPVQEIKSPVQEIKPPVQDKPPKKWKLFGSGKKRKTTKKSNKSKNKRGKNKTSYYKKK